MTDTKAIVGGRVIDGAGGRALEPGVVLVDKDRVAAVGRPQQVPVPSDAEVIDACGKTVMPGIWDCHIHLTPNRDLPPDVRTHLGVGYRAISTLQRSLDRGITTMVSITGGPPAVELSVAINEGLIRHCPRQLAAGVVNATGGHVRGRAADGPWEVRKAVREVISEGVDLIKTAASGGFQWEHERVSWTDYTREELIALVEEAHSKDKPVQVHAHSQPGLNNAIEAGCDMILHGALIDDEALEGIAARGLYFIPTLCVTSDPRIERQPRPWTKERMQHAQPHHREGVRKAHEMGVRLAVGTDGQVGDAMYELMELVSCGLSPMDAIVAGTRNSADAHGLLDEVGTLEPGKKADLIMVEGNPLDDIGLLFERERILLVMRDGRVECTDEAHKEYLHPPG